MRIIIIMSHYQHGSPWPSPATLLYRPSLPVGLQGYILYPHRPVLCMFQLVVLPLLVHMRGSTRVCHLCLSLLLQQCPACLVRLILIVFVMLVGDCTAAALLGAASRTCSMFLAKWLILNNISSILGIVLSVGAVEYADCASAESKDPPFNEWLGYDTKPFDGEAPVLEP